MRELIYLDSALVDFADIIKFITQQSGSAAIGRNFVNLLYRKCMKPASLPGILGQIRPELNPDIRSLSFKGCVIFFRYAHDAVEIVNVLEGHRDFIAYFVHDAG